MTRQPTQNKQSSKKGAAGQTISPKEGEEDEGRERDGENSNPRQIRGLVAELLKKMEAKLAKAEGIGSVGDFIRLVQLEREMAEEEPAREIVVTWVDRVKGFDSGK